MQVDRILYPIQTLGPGERLVIWTIGCSKQCYNCANPELWNNQPEKNICVEELANIIKQAVKNQVIDGITITGGDPLEQSEELNKLLPLLKENTDDILVFTGYTTEEAQNIFSESEWNNFTLNTTAMIDGPYIDDLNDNKCVLRGSTNQNIVYFDDTKKGLYLQYLEKGRSVQNVYYKNNLISVGIHNKDI